MKINIMMVMMVTVVANLEKMMIEKVMVMMVVVTMVGVGDDGSGDEDDEKNGMIQLLAQRKGQNRQRQLRYFHLPRYFQQGPAAGSPAPPASPPFRLTPAGHSSRL